MKIVDIKNKQNKFYNCLDINYRKAQLIKLKNNILKFEEQIYIAFLKDLNKSKKETFLSEINEVINEIDYHIKNIDKWAKPTKVKNTYATLFTKCYIIPKPKGKILIISPFNYPFNLAFTPLIGAVSAGNKVLMKLSSQTPNINNVIYNIIDESFDENHVTYIMNSDLHSYDEIFEYEPNLVFFTGSTNIGKKIAKQCVEKNIEYITELGGMCSCILLDDEEIFYKRIVWAKFLNAGQTCVSINQLLVNKNINWKNKLINEIKLQYPSPLKLKNIPKIINQKSFDRLIEIIDKNKNNIIYGGNYDVETLIIEPTIILVNDYKQIKEYGELFGPILFVYETNENISEIIKIVNYINDCPLAAYLYSNNIQYQNYFFNNINAGGYCINDSITHILNHYLPFGGVYDSGYGSYHGYFSFKSFSFLKPILKNNLNKDFPIKYINNDFDLEKTKKSFNLLRKFIKQ